MHSHSNDPTKTSLSVKSWQRSRTVSKCVKHPFCSQFQSEVQSNRSEEQKILCQTLLYLHKSNMSLMYSAIEHNNKGVEYLSKGMHFEALHEFKAATHFLHTLTKEMQTKSVSRASGTIACIQSPNAIETGNSFICSNPIFMSQTTANEPQSSCTVESGTILLNMALCYHLNALNMNSMQGARESAITLYEMAYSLGLQCSEDSRSQQLVLTALNNLGCLYQEVGEFNKSQIFLQDLTTYLNSIGSTVESNASRLRCEFVLNVMILRNPNTCAASA